VYGGFDRGIVNSFSPQREKVSTKADQLHSGIIHGTVLAPSESGPHPAVVIIAGSGPTDRDGNSAVLAGPNNSLRLLAEGLAERGIASVRYDKRGIAESAAAAPREEDLRFEAYVADAGAWVEQLRADETFASVSVVGHSEGSLIGMLAAEQADAHAFVSVAGVAQRGSDVLRDQLQDQLPPDLWTESDRILTALEAGETVGDVPDELVSLFRPTVQPYLISWFQYVPAEELALLQVSVLIAQGTTDLQVPVAEAEALHAAKPDAELLVVDGMNHVLKRVSADPAQQQASYSDPSLPVVEELVESVARFVAQ
jgi:pimeloyl-ACP methyl ester carboxylesterase